MLPWSILLSGLVTGRYKPGSMPAVRVAVVSQDEKGGGSALYLATSIIPPLPHHLLSMAQRVAAVGGSLPPTVAGVDTFGGPSMTRGQRERARKRQRDMNAFLARATPEEIANHAAHNERYTRNKQLAQAKKDKKSHSLPRQPSIHALTRVKTHHLSVERLTRQDEVLIPLIRDQHPFYAPPPHSIHLRSTRYARCAHPAPSIRGRRRRPRGIAASHGVMIRI